MRSRVTPRRGGFWRVSLSHNDTAPAAEKAPEGASRLQGLSLQDGRGRLRSPATAIAIDLGPDDLPLYARTLKLLSEPAPGTAVD